jgi:hypothetical protein
MSDAKTILVAAVALTISKDTMTAIHREVPAHELNVLGVIFGKDNIAVDDAAVDPIEINPDAEAERLTHKYGGDALERVFGKNYEFSIPEAVLKHQVKAAAPAPAAPKVTKLADMNKESLLVLAGEAGVAADEGMTKAQIIAAIEAKKAEQPAA